MNIDLVSLANKGIRGLHPYLPGKPVSELERELGISDIIKLASNENPAGCSSLAQQAIQNELVDITRYPDANGFYLKEALCEHLSVAMDQITLGNGSNDVLDLIARTFAGKDDEVVFSQHAFVVYPIVTQAVEAKAVVVPALNYGHDLKAMAEAISDKCRLVFIANPNNPTGICLFHDELLAFIQQVPKNVMVVIDEAYYEYATDDRYPQTLAWLQEFPNLIITRTFSKAYGLASLRVGYSISHSDVAGLLNRVRQPFNVNSFALAAATAALKDKAFLKQAVDLNQQGMDYLQKELSRLGYDFIPSLGNFITVDMDCDAMDIYQKLLQQGVIVRPVANYQMPQHLRVSIGLMQENQRFIRALKLVAGR
ncbi:MAG: histidinol-phosphate transaminase [Gammaproteobacteria bacterium CG22_combo_CG10-13_8_21_14_all_40_8]|nr:MAG: histidinol-phosphate transaminase [Gammaproteobacteria bacterium CG22_combo_CG10-13_8_21_14_all_40_8]